MLNENPFFSNDKQEIAILIDPDKFSKDNTEALKKISDKLSPSYFFVGGSYMEKGNLDVSVRILKAHFDLPVIIFPGDHAQISPSADAILFLSLLSGRNPEYLIGQQVKAAPAVKKSGLKVIPTAYLLVDGGKITTVQYVTGTLPLPADKPGLIAATALAGQYMGMQAVYLEAGSGAVNHVPETVVQHVRNEVDIPIIVGGGITTPQQMEGLFKAGANLVVLGTSIENMFH